MGLDLEKTIETGIIVHNTFVVLEKKKFIMLTTVLIETCKLLKNLH